MKMQHNTIWVAYVMIVGYVAFAIYGLFVLIRRKEETPDTYERDDTREG